MKKLIPIFLILLSQIIFGYNYLDNPPELYDSDTEIISVDVTNTDQEILINWHSPASPGKFKFEVERASGRCSELSFETIGEPNYAILNSESGFEYFFVDNKPLNGRAYYRIKLLDKNDNVYYSEYIEIKPLKENKLAINHFEQSRSNNILEFEFNVPEKGNVSILIFDPDGETIDTITNKNYQPGKHNICYKTNKLKKGVYFYSIELENEIITKKLEI